MYVLFRQDRNKLDSEPAEAPHMSKVKWSQAQKDHHQRMREASKYASAAVTDPELSAIGRETALRLAERAV